MSIVDNGHFFHNRKTHMEINLKYCFIIAEIKLILDFERREICIHYKTVFGRSL